MFAIFVYLLLTVYYSAIKSRHCNTHVVSARALLPCGQPYSRRSIHHFSSGIRQCCHWQSDLIEQASLNQVSCI
jgi:hypothetical protein